MPQDARQDPSLDERLAYGTWVCTPTHSSTLTKTDAQPKRAPAWTRVCMLPQEKGTKTDQEDDDVAVLTLKVCSLPAAKV